MYYNKYIKYKKKYINLIDKYGGTLKTDLPQFLHNKLLWIHPYFTYFDKYIIKNYITRKLETNMTSLDIKFVGNLGQNELFNKLEKNIDNEINKNKDYYNTKFSKIDSEFESKDIIIEEKELIVLNNSDMKECIWDETNFCDYLYKFYADNKLDLMNYSESFTDLDKIDNAIDQFAELNKLSINDQNKLTYLIKEFENKTLQELNDTQSLQIINFLYKLNTYYNCEYLVDKNHWGIIGYKKYIDLIINEIKENHKINGNEHIYIIADSTIDFSLIYTNFHDKWKNPMSQNIVNERIKYLKDKFKSELNINDIVVDAVGATGYFATFDHNFNLELFIENYRNIFTMYENYNKDFNKLINVINFMIDENIITLNNGNIFLIRLINNFYENYSYPKYTNILTIGYGNDIDYSVDNDPFVTLQQAELMIKIYWSFCHHFINDYDSAINYCINNGHIEIRS